MNARRVTVERRFQAMHGVEVSIRTLPEPLQVRVDRLRSSGGVGNRRFVEVLVNQRLAWNRTFAQ